MITSVSDGDKQQTVLLTLGRLPVALDIARSFASAGWRVIVAEPFGMHLLRMSRSVARCYRTRAPRDDASGYLDDLRQIIADEGVSLVVPVSEETLHVAALKGELGGVDVFCERQDKLLNVHDKLAFNRLAADCGLSVPTSYAGKDTLCKEVAGAGDFVVKPRLSCSGRGVQFLNKGTSGPYPNDTVVQQKMTGTELSSFAIARDGVVLCNVVYAARATSGSVSVVFERISGSAVTRSIGHWVNTFVEKTHYTGLIAFDFIVDDDGVPFALECNPRATSGIHFIETASLASALSGVSLSSIGLRPDTLLQEAYSSFTAALGALGRPDERWRRFGLLRRARDVSWSRSDPWPFLLMTINTYRLIGLAVIRRRTFAEVAALDIEWTRDAH